MADQHDVHLAGRFGDVEDRIADPVHAGDRLAVEGHFLPQRAADALHDVAFYAFHQPIRVDDLPAVVRHGELARPDLTGGAVNIDLRDHRHARAVALRIGDAAAGHFVAGLIAARRGPRVPFRLFRRRLDHGDIARLLDVAQAKLDRVGANRRRHLVDEGFAGEVDLRSDRIAQVRTAQGRGAVEQRRDGLPGQALVLEGIGFRRHAETVAE